MLKKVCFLSSLTVLIFSNNSFAIPQPTPTPVGNCENVFCTVPPATIKTCKDHITCPKGWTKECYQFGPPDNSIFCYCNEPSSIGKDQQTPRSQGDSQTTSNNFECMEVSCPPDVPQDKCKALLNCLSGDKPVCKEIIRNGKKILKCTCEDAKTEKDY